MDTTDRTEIEPYPFGGGVASDDVDAPAIHIRDDGIALVFESLDGRELGSVVGNTPGDLARIRAAFEDSIRREQAAREHQAGDLSGVGRSEIPK